MKRLVATAAVLLAVAAPAAQALTPANPALAGSVSDNSTLSGATSVAVAGNFAYTTAYYPGDLTAVDISNPASPSVTGSDHAPYTVLSGTEGDTSNASTVNIIGGVAYVASKNRNGPCLPGPVPTCGSGTNDDGSGNGFAAFNISTNPAVPHFIGSVRDGSALFGDYGVTAAVSGNLAYTAAQGCLNGQPCPTSTVGNAFNVIDISNPAAPTIKATIQDSLLLDHVTAVALSGNYAYVTAFYSHRLTVVNISNSSTPQIVTSLLDATNLANPSDVAIRGNYAYVTDQDTTSPQFTVVDISNPANPHVVAEINNSSAMGGAYRIRLRGNFAYVAGDSANAMAVVDISDPTNPKLIASVADTNHFNHTTGVDVSSSGAYLIGTSPFLSSESQSLYPTFSALHGSVSTIQLDPSPIAVSVDAGPAPVTTHISPHFNFSVSDVVSTTQCSMDGGAFSPCVTGVMYNNLSLGSHVFRVQATDAGGITATASYSWQIEQAPANTAKPKITGTTKQGSTLTLLSGTWSGSPAPNFTRKWMDCDQAGKNCTTIKGATSSTYKLVASDVGSTIEATVTGTNGAGSANATTAPTATVTAAKKGITLKLTVPKHQKVVKHGVLIAKLKCSLRTYLGVYAKIKIGNGKAFKIDSFLRSVKAGHTATFKISLTAAQITKLKHALKAHKKITATVYGARVIGSNHHHLAITKGQPVAITARALGGRVWVTTGFVFSIFG